MALTPGTHLGPYEIAAKIGVGGVGDVYRARDTRVDRVVALQASKEPLTEPLLMAIRAAARLVHPHICHVYEVTFVDDTALLAMEYIEGETLADRLSRGKLSLEEVLRFATEIARALAHAHGQRVRHGALNPRNIVLTSGGVKLTDFGLAIDLRHQLAMHDVRQGIPFDTLRYLSPEQLDGKEANVRSDTFAFGSILYEMATGRRAFEGDSQEILTTEILHTPPAIGGLVVPATELTFLIHKCLQKEPADRPETVDVCFELERALKAASESKPASAPLHLDDNVQFTVYRPQTIAPGKWYTLLAFAHLSERQPDSPPTEPDPVREIEERAQKILREEAQEYRRVSQDSSQPVPREGLLTFVPEIKGVQFNPATRSFQWQEPVHCEEFRLRAQPSLDGRQARGRMSVFLGSILLAELSVSIRVDSKHGGALRTDVPVIDSARPYRKIFASYSHKDAAIVSQFEKYAGASGDEYLRDAVTLRSGEHWQQGLCRLIEAADVFQLFWSWNALASEFVRQEWEYAIGLHRKHFVRPVYWEEPLPAKEGLPPDALRQLHFQRIPVMSAPGSGVVLISAPGAGGPTILTADVPIPNVAGGAQGGTTRVEGLGSARGGALEPVLKPSVPRRPGPRPQPVSHAPDRKFIALAIIIVVAILLLWSLI